MASLLMAPLKHYIGSLLRSYLGTFVVGVELDALGFLGSEIVLNDVERELPPQANITAALIHTAHFLVQLRPTR